MRRRAGLVLTDPHAGLAAAALAVLLLEALRGSATLLSSPVWPVGQAAAACAGLGLAWRRQDRLTLRGVVCLGLLFQLAWIGLHLALGVASDGDSSRVYAGEGHTLLAGAYPASEYPPGAVLLFALDNLLAGGEAGVRVSQALLMVPFQAATVVWVWRLGTRSSAWFAALVALWPLDAFFWEFKFDLAPTAALVAGLLLATRRRWTLSGVALGLGATLKWTPALSALALAIWLMRQGHRRAAAALAGSACAAFALINLPFLVSAPHALVAAYHVQGGRPIAAESMFYLPPVIGLRHTIAIISLPVGAPGWANLAAEALQVVLLLAILATLGRVRELRAAVSLAAMGPVVFLLSNRVFSPQYLITMVAAWAVAGALLATHRRDQLPLAGLMATATLANVLVYPTGVSWWPTCSLLLFVSGFAASGWVVRRSLRLG